MPLTETPKKSRKGSQTSDRVRPVPVDGRIRVAEKAAARIEELHEQIGDSLVQLGYRGEYWLTAGFRTIQQISSTECLVEEIYINLANPLKKRTSKIRSLLSSLFQTIPGVIIVRKGAHESRLQLPDGSSWTKERVAPDVGKKDHAPSDSTASTSESTATTSSNPTTSVAQDSRRPGGSSYNGRNGGGFGEEGEDEEGGEGSKDKEEGHEEDHEESGGEDEGGQDPNEDDHDPSSHMNSQLLAGGGRTFLPLYSKIDVKPKGEPFEKLKFVLTAQVTVEDNNNLAVRDYPFGDTSVHGPWLAVDVHRFKAFFESIPVRPEEKPHYSPERLTFDASTTPRLALPWWEPDENVIEPTSQRQDRNRGMKYLLGMGAKPSATIEASHGTTVSQDTTIYPYSSGQYDEDDLNRVHAYIEYTTKDKTKTMDVLPPHAPQIYFTYTEEEAQGSRQLVIMTSALWSSRRKWRSTGDSQPPLLYHNFTHEMKCELDLNAPYTDEGLFKTIPTCNDGTEDVVNPTHRDFEARTVEVGSNKFVIDRSVVAEVKPRGWKRFFRKRQ